MHHTRQDLHRRLVVAALEAQLLSNIGLQTRLRADRIPVDSHRIGDHGDRLLRRCNQGHVEGPATAGFDLHGRLCGSHALQVCGQPVRPRSNQEESETAFGVGDRGHVATVTAECHGSAGNAGARVVTNDAVHSAGLNTVRPQRQGATEGDREDPGQRVQRTILHDCLRTGLIRGSEDPIATLFEVQTLIGRRSQERRMPVLPHKLLADPVAALAHHGLQLAATAWMIGAQIDLFPGIFLEIVEAPVRALEAHNQLVAAVVDHPPVVEA